MRQLPLYLNSNSGSNTACIVFNSLNFFCKFNLGAYSEQQKQLNVYIHILQQASTAVQQNSNINFKTLFVCFVISFVALKCSLL